MGLRALWWSLFLKTLIYDKLTQLQMIFCLRYWLYCPQQREGPLLLNNWMISLAPLMIKENDKRE
jgi:hypothetical protein